MARINLWRAKRIQRRIDKYHALSEKFKAQIGSLKKWIKAEEKILKPLLKSLDEMEFFEFGLATGYIEKKDIKK